MVQGPFQTILNLERPVVLSLDEQCSKTREQSYCTNAEEALLP